MIWKVRKYKLSLIQTFDKRTWIGPKIFCSFYSTCIKCTNFLQEHNGDIIFFTCKNTENLLLENIP